MKKIPQLGEQEGLVLAFIQEQAPVTVRQVSDRFAPLARTTILTVMDRLRQKGFIQRVKVEGVFSYTARIEQKQLLKKQIKDFVDKTLGGTVSPFFSYLVDTPNLSADEKDQLRMLVDKLSKNEEGR